MEYPTETDKFVNNILAQLTIPNPGDRNAVWAQIAILYRQWYTEAEILDFCYCMEEVNPDLNKKIAFERMQQIRKQVEERLKKEHPIKEETSLCIKAFTLLQKIGMIRL